MKNTLAWDLSRNFDSYNCIDIATDTIYEKAETVEDPLLFVNNAR
jgi:hypothetical protein